MHLHKQSNSCRLGLQLVNWCVFASVQMHTHPFVCECIANVYICLIPCMYVLICVYASTSACLFSCECMFLCVMCKNAQSHEGHWSLRPPHDLSYFYREVSLASPQTPPVEGESSRSGWSAVMGAFWTHTCAHTQSHIWGYIGSRALIYSPTRVKVNNTYISKLTQGSPGQWAGLSLSSDFCREKQCKLVA